MLGSKLMLLTLGLQASTPVQAVQLSASHQPADVSGAADFHDPPSRIPARLPDRCEEGDKVFYVSNSAARQGRERIFFGRVVRVINHEDRDELSYDLVLADQLPGSWDGIEHFRATWPQESWTIQTDQDGKFKDLAEEGWTVKDATANKKGALQRNVFPYVENPERKLFRNQRSHATAVRFISDFASYDHALVANAQQRAREQRKRVAYQQASQCNGQCGGFSYIGGGGGCDCSEPTAETRRAWEEHAREQRQEQERRGVSPSYCDCMSYVGGGGGCTCHK